MSWFLWLLLHGLCQAAQSCVMADMTHPGENKCVWSSYGSSSPLPAFLLTLCLPWVQQTVCTVWTVRQLASWAGSAIESPKQTWLSSTLRFFSLTSLHRIWEYGIWILLFNKEFWQQKIYVMVILIHSQIYIGCTTGRENTLMTVKLSSDYNYNWSHTWLQASGHGIPNPGKHDKYSEGGQVNEAER